MKSNQLWENSFSFRCPPASTVEDDPVPLPGFSRQAPLSVRVASAIRTPHFPKVRDQSLWSSIVEIKGRRLEILHDPWKKASFVAFIR
jgi:hypothetical protein